MQSTQRSAFLPYRVQGGFTLIELAIVLIIIGLVIGGAMSGRTLLKAAEHRAIYTDAQTYMSAVSSFVDKYGSLPGDMYDAENIWGQAAAGAACKTADNQNKSTCDGNGNGRIELGEVDGASGVKTVEHFRAWQQLASASLLKGNMTGTPGTGGDNHAVPGDNVPRSTMDGGGYTLYYQGVGAGNFFAVDPTEVYGHILHFGLFSAAGITDAPLLLPQEAWEVDIKVDDGVPFSGSVRTYTNASQPNCVNAADNTATYTVSYDDGRACNLIFLTGF